MPRQIEINEQVLENVVVKRQDRKGQIQFLAQVEQKINAGYKLVLDGKYAPKSYPNSAWFVPKTSSAASQPEVAVSTPLSILEDLKGKQPLLEFAKQHSIEVPEELKVPLAIKKFIKAELEAK